MKFSAPHFKYLIQSLCVYRLFCDAVAANVRLKINREESRSFFRCFLHLSRLTKVLFLCIRRVADEKHSEKRASLSHITTVSEREKTRPFKVVRFVCAGERFFKGTTNEYSNFHEFSP